jgi:putative FmdB family regulatory protein
MPIYEYECGKCGRIEEILQKISDKPLNRCSHCSGKLHKIVSHSSFHLKGSGWYVTDYARSSKSSTTRPKKEGEPKKASSSESTGKTGDGS